MFDDIFSSLVNQWKAIWTAFGDAGPLANAIQIITFVGAAAGSIRWYVRHRLKDKDGQILDLKDDLANRNKKLDELRSELKYSERLCETLGSQLPRTALTKAEEERREGNYTIANQVLLDWLKSEGETISELLLYRAKWAAAHAVGEVRALGLVVAEAYAIAASVFSRQDHTAVDLTDDVESLRVEEGQAMPPLTVALDEFDERRDDVFDIDRAAEASEAEDEAKRRYNCGHYHLALPLVERAAILRVQTVGPNALQTLRTQYLRCYILLGLGHSEEALPIARAVADAEEASPALGIKI